MHNESNYDVAKYLLANGADAAAAHARFLEIAESSRRYKRLVAYQKTNIRVLKRLTSRKALSAPVPAPPVDPAKEKTFEVEAARYRALAVKPALPQAARRFKVQAEAAVRDKRFDRAVERYAQAFAIAPWWPEGRFNRALILGELRRYAEAIREMKRYLALVPNAADAQKAQDTIYEWEDK